MKWMIILYIFVFQLEAFAQSVQGALSRVNSELMSIGYILSITGIIFAAFSFLTGNQEAGPRTARVVMGTLLLGTGAGIVQFLTRLG
jgi:hypothetical protein